MAFVLADVDQIIMARCLGVSLTTLQRAFRRELDQGYATVKAELAGKVVTMARAGSEKMLQFYLETHGWVRSERLVVADGGVDDADIKALSDEQIAHRIAALSKRGKR